MAYTPKNNFNFQLKRTGVGEVGFRKKLLRDVACCDDPLYQFYGGFQPLPSQDFSRELTIRGGCPDFSWNIDGPYFSFTHASTSGRTNTISADVSTPSGYTETAVIIDSCGIVRYMKITLIGLVCSIHEIGIEETNIPPIPSYVIYGAGFDGGELENDGRLGMNAATAIGVSTFQPVTGPQEFSDVVCGDDYTIAQTKLGKLYGAGLNNHGQYGDGSTTNNIVLSEINENIWDMVSAIYYSTLAIKSGGSLWGAGWNLYGELGLGHSNEEHSFTRETTESIWKFVVAGEMHSLAIRDSGVLFGTGLNTTGGQLSQGTDYPDRYSNFIQIRRDDGGSAPFPLDNSVWKSASCDAFSSFGIKEGGTLWSCGANSFGQLGLGDTTVREFFTRVGSSLWSSVSSRYYSTVAIKEDGTLWGCGYNEHGQLGLGDTDRRHSFTQIGSDTWKKAIIAGGDLLAIRSDDTLWGAGWNAFSELGLDHSNEVHVLTQEITSKTWVDVAGGLHHTMALLL